ncbi:MAG TPA: S8 family serine peptidase [Gemmataceae bacterium]|nr:S8 family serine peptidase [Gemmataceae bacterium]
MRRGEDVYRVPLAELRLVILRQRDPSGTNLPADDFEVVAQSAGVPLRLDNQPTAATYEQSVEFTAEAGGRYALRVEGRAPEGTRPRGMPTLPAAQQSSELRPRIFVQTLAGPGRAVFADFTTDRPGRGFEGGSLGIPADAHRVITVGAADRAGRPQPYSAGGPPMNQDLTIKPDVLAYDVPAAKDGPYGTSLATTFAAGLAATAISAGVPRSAFLETLQVRPGTLLRIPTDWPARRP